MRTRALLDFCSWLEQTPLSQTIQSTGWIVPAVQTVHILSIAAVLSSVLMIDLRWMGFLGRDQPLARVSERFQPVICGTLPALLVDAIIVTLSHQVPLGRNPAFWELSAGRRGAAPVVAVLSLALWAGIVFAGRWIAYY